MNTYRITKVRLFPDGTRYVQVTDTQCPDRVLDHVGSSSYLDGVLKRRYGIRPCMKTYTFNYG